MAAETGGVPPREGLFAALKGLVATVVAIGRTRFSLLVVELEEEKFRVVDMLVSAFAALFLLGLGIVLLIVTLAVAFWEQRLLVLGLSTAVIVVAGLMFVGRLVADAKRPSALFRSSLKELDRDLEALRDSAKDAL